MFGDARRGRDRAFASLHLLHRRRRDRQPHTHDALPNVDHPVDCASGSIAGVLDAFRVLRPKSRIVTVFPLVVYWAMAEIPSIVFIPILFLMQFANSFLSLASVRSTQKVAGIAWWAHVGGFAFGAAAGAFWRISQRRVAAASPPVNQIRGV